MVDQFHPQWSFLRGRPSSRSRAVEAPRSAISASRLCDELVGDHRAPPLVATVAVARHPMPHQRPQLDRHERLDVRPVLHQAARPALGRAADQVDVVGTHPGVERHVVGALQHVDRVDLEHAGAGQRAREGAHRRRVVGRVEEALGGQRDPAGLGLGQRGRRAGRVGEGTDANLAAAGDSPRVTGPRVMVPVVLEDDFRPTRPNRLAPGGAGALRIPGVLELRGKRLAGRVAATVAACALAAVALVLDGQADSDAALQAAGGQCGAAADGPATATIKIVPAGLRLEVRARATTTVAVGGTLTVVNNDRCRTRSRRWRSATTASRCSTSRSTRARPSRSSRSRPCGDGTYAFYCRFHQS